MMDAVKFAHDRNRMCNAQLGQGEGCKNCPLNQIWYHSDMPACDLYRV